tara:strand:- start:5576 stop:6193 length:618 start_codon:yes stop_codon:yes gene_type:complete
MNKIKKFFYVALFSFALGSLNAAQFESNIALSSEYMWRGMTQTDGQAAVSGGFDISGESGAYFGVWGSNVEYGDDATMELDYYVGYAGETESGVSYDFGYLLYDFPGADYDAEEIYLGLGFSYFGVTYYAGQDDAADNLEFSASLGESGVGLTFGDYDEIGKYTILSYDLPFDLAGLTVSLSWNDIDYDDGLAKDDDVFAITFSM